MGRYFHASLFSAVTFLIKANGPAIWRAERLGTARWAVPAKEPACRAGQLPDAASGQSQVLGMVL